MYFIVLKIFAENEKIRYFQGDVLTLNLLGTAEFCAGLFLCTAEFNANYV